MSELLQTKSEEPMAMVNPARLAASSRARIDLRYAVGLLVALAAFCIYITALKNDFAYDDVVLIPRDVRVTEFRFSEIFSTPYWAREGMGLYRPLVTLSFAVDWALSDGSSAWFHAANALWHTAATVTLYALLLTWFGTIAAGAGALIFAVHPVHVEAVANIVGRAELMAGFFMLLACVLWVRDQPRNNMIRISLVCLLYVLAMVCKESAVMLPALLVLIDATRGKWNGLQELPRYVLRHWRVYVCMTAVMVAAVGLRVAVTGVASPTQLDPINEVLQTPVDRIRTSMQLWPQYVRLLLFPRILLADYGPRVMMPLDSGDPLILIGASVLGALLIGGIVALNRGHSLAALTIWWLPVSVLPVASLIVPIGVLLAERTLYVPSFATALLVAMFVHSASRTTGSQRRSVQFGVAGVLCIAVALGAWRTVKRIPDWRSTDTILMAQIRDRPDSFRGYWQAARIERRRNNPEMALQHYGYALYLWPYREQLLVDAAVYASENRRPDLALRWAGFGAETLPNSLRLQQLTAAYTLDAGDTAKARVAIQNALRIAPTDSLARRMAAAIDSARSK